MSTHENKVVVTFGDFLLNVTDHMLFHAGEPVRLTPKAIDLLCKLVENQDGVVPKSELKKAAWAEEVVTDDSLHQKITELRQGLGDSKDGRYIKTVWKRGYRFQGVAVRRDGPPTSRSLLPVRQGTPDDLAVPINLVAPKEMVPGRATRGRRRFRGRLSVFIILAFLACCGGLAFYVNPPPTVGGFHQITHDGRQRLSQLFVVHSRIYSQTTVGVVDSVGVDGGEPETLIPPVPGPGLCLWNVNPRTGELLLAAIDDKGWRMWSWLPGSSRARFLGPDRLNAAAFSPDGDTLAHFNAATGTLDLLDPVSLDRRLSKRVLPKALAGWRQNADTWLRFSPDRARLRFDVTDFAQERTAIWEVDTSGENAHPLYPDSDAGAPRSSCCGSWSPDGRWFVFSDGVEDGGKDLWVATESPWFFRRSRGRPTQLTNGPLRFRWPAVAENGKAVFAIGTSHRLEAIRFDVGTRKMAPFLEGRAAVDANFSLDGQNVVYVDEFSNTVWRSRPDGREAAQLTFPPMEAHQPHWSPDGKRIAFMGKLPGRRWRAYVIAPGGNQAKTVVEDDNEQGVPTWSKDGRYLAFGDRGYQRPGGEMRIHIWDFQAQRLSDLPGSLGRWTARWSPDGQYIAAQSPDFHNLYVYDLRKATWRQLATFPITDSLNWSFDSKYLYFWVRGGGLDGCYRAAILGRQVEKLLAAKDYPALSQAYLSVAPDGSLILNRTVDTHDIYAIDIKWPWFSW